MTVTKEMVLERAKELSLTLSDSEVEQLVKDGKLPEKKTEPAGTKIEELAGRYSTLQLAQMVVELRGENAERRHTERSLKEQAEQLTRELGGLKETAAKYPDLEGKFKQSQDVIQKYKETEKRRREAALSTLDDTKKAKLTYLLDVDKIGSDEFEGTVELLLSSKSPGVEPHTPAGEPPKEGELTPFEKQEAVRMGLSPEAYREVQGTRKGRAPDKIHVQDPLKTV